MLSLFGYLLNCNISKIYFKAKIDNIILEWGVNIAPPPTQSECVDTKFSFITENLLSYLETGVLYLIK